MPSIKKQYKTNSKRSLCKSKSDKKCKKLKGCKVAKGTKRRFCRKIKNKSYKNKSKKSK